MSNVESLLDLPRVRALGEDHGFWSVFREIADPVPRRGNAVPDAHIAAVLCQHGVGTFYTNDADFTRFGFLKVINPFD